MEYKIGVYRIPAVLSGYLIIILVDSSHDIELDQACSLHFLIIKTALGSIYKIGYETAQVRFQREADFEPVLKLSPVSHL